MIPDPMVVAAAVGLFAGWLGVAIAAYLQLISPYKIRFRYIAAFYLLGCGLILSNLHPVWSLTAETAYWISIVGNLLFIPLELWGFRHALREGAIGYREEPLDLSFSD